MSILVTNVQDIRTAVRKQAQIVFDLVYPVLLPNGPSDAFDVAVADLVADILKEFTSIHRAELLRVAGDRTTMKA
jgi:hypothetical protein